MVRLFFFRRDPTLLTDRGDPKTNSRPRMTQIFVICLNRSRSVSWDLFSSNGAGVSGGSGSGRRNSGRGVTTASDDFIVLTKASRKIVPYYLIREHLECDPPKVKLIG